MQERLEVGSHVFIIESNRTITEIVDAVMKKEISIACPCCRNKRLFDAEPDTEGIIKIKCPICRSVVAVSFHKKKIRTERIATQ